MQHSSGGGGEQLQPPPPPPPTMLTTTTTATTRVQYTHDQSAMVAEEASPISSRPPAMNLDEFMRLSEDAFGGVGGSSVGGGGAASASSGGGNRWPREETLALLKIRSEMDAVFRDSTPKGPLWEDVSRKLSELGYKRSAKKCKEKFENLQKYYKRTKEGRAGRQDGKSYKFFSQLEALHSTTTSNPTERPMQPPMPPPTTSALDVSPVSVGIMPNMPGVSSVSIFSTTPPGFSGAVIRSTDPTAVVGTTSNVGGAISLSMDESTEEEEDEEEEEHDRSSAGVGESSRKRNREQEQEQEGSKGDTRRMMDFFERLTRQVMQKQESMQQRFLEVIEKREQERLVREEEWKRQETARLCREHELMAKERAASASRDAAIVSLLQKITGQTIQLPSIAVTTSLPPPPPSPPPTQPQMQLMPIAAVPTQPPPSAPPPVTPSQIQQTPPSTQQYQYHLAQQEQHGQVPHHRHRSSISSEVIMAIPEKEVAPSGSHEPLSSSRWPREEVIALINVRSGFESRYQETGPKGPLWEEVSARMNQLGYKRNAKRCKEKWENINKYYKKVKESNTKRREDSKTCPYYEELDKLYRQKIIGAGTSSGGGFATQNISPEQQQQPPRESLNLNPDLSTMGQEGSNLPAIQQSIQVTESRQGNEESKQKPEGIIMKLTKKQGTQQQGHEKQSLLDALESDEMNHEEEDDDGEIDEEDDEVNDESQEQSEMGYKIEFQRQTTSANGGGNGAPSSFFTMVQ